MNNPVNFAISFGLLISVVGGAFFYVYSGGPAERPKEPWMGITDGLIIDQAAAETLGLDQEHGFLIFAIASPSPADKAGLRGADEVVTINEMQIPVGGDIIVSMDYRQIKSVEDVCAVLAQKQVGDSVRFEVSRDGSLQQAEIILEELPSGETTEC